MKEDLKREQNTKIDVKLFVTNLCPQCVIAIDRIERIAKNNKQINVEIVKVLNGNTADQQFEKLTDTPYFLIQEKYVVPGTSSENYILNVLKRAGATV